MIEFALVYMIGTVVVNQSQTFDNVNDCLYFAERLTAQPNVPNEDGKPGKIIAYCKPVRK